MKIYLSIIFLVLPSSPVQSNEFAEMLKLAEQGNDNAQCTLGYAYANGRGVSENDKTAAMWDTKADIAVVFHWSPRAIRGLSIADFIDFHKEAVERGKG